MCLMCGKSLQKMEEKVFLEIKNKIKKKNLP